ncbi:Cj0069 family protein [Phycicoccus sp. Soil748]|uniref:Cj0069 family protein n=1 Tax=Phycicoccus sp. Soil748 TaxID=1736397 RepID=UPI00138F85E4|nr:Cj0069 family protein [Phycicoccus sp. Soil748]
MHRPNSTRAVQRRRATVAVLVRSDDPKRTAERLKPVVEALAAADIHAEVVEFDDDHPDDWRRNLEKASGVLVWADPLTDRGPRSTLDAQLTEIALAGTWVSAHPGVIRKIGTKDVLVTTRGLPWGTDSFAYPTPDIFREFFPDRLAKHGTLVVKGDRGNGGRTVWKITLLEPHRAPPAAAPTATVMVQHARLRDDTHTVTTLGQFMTDRSQIYTAGAGSGHLVDQPYEAGIAEGLIRCYVVRSTVVGFALQGASDSDASPAGHDSRKPAVLGVPAPKTMVPSDQPEFRALRHRLEDEWIPAMRSLLDIAPDQLPVLWDIDLIQATSNAPELTGFVPGFVLCEINASSVIPFPPEAPSALASAVAEILSS